MATLGIEPGGSGVKQVEGKDETGNPYVRFYASLPRAANVGGAATVTAPAGSKLMFQRIIHDETSCAKPSRPSTSSTDDLRATVTSLFASETVNHWRRTIARSEVYATKPKGYPSRLRPTSLRDADVGHL